MRSTCPYCGVGCQVDMHIKDDRIYRVTAPFDSAPNYGNLCVKGRFGMDFVNHPRRLRTPLIRKELGGQRQPVGLDGFRPATWEEALDMAASRLAQLVTRRGGDAIGTYASAKATNEDNYVFQKFVRAVLHTNNVDHCSRLCHSGSVTGLQLAIGSSAMSNSIAEMEHLDTFIVTGSNTTETHPVISLSLKAAVRRHGAKLIVVDPRQIEMVDFATLWLRQRPGTDVAVFSAMAHVIVQEGLVNREFLAARTEGFEEYKSTLQEMTPEWAAGVSGVPAEDIRRAARMYAEAQAAAIYWGMGISQSTHGTENALCLANLALMTGQIGRPGTGLNPLRGQNNVQGASDSGALPPFLTTYQRVDDPAARQRFEAAWGVPLSTVPGLTVTEMVDGALAGDIKGMYIMGENPLLTEPYLSHSRHAMAELDFVLFQDIFLNETGEYADVVLPARSFAEKDGTFVNSDRRVQRGRQAVAPVGASRADWDITCDLARRIEQKLGRNRSAGFAYDNAEEIWDEMRSVTPDFGGITYERLEREGGVHWPCPSLEHPGTPYLFADTFPRGKGKFWPVTYGTLSELPDEEYPFVLSTGRVLYHWHGGTLSRHSVLDQIYPEAVVEIHPDDARSLAIATGDWLEVVSRRGHITARALVTARSPEGVIFIPFHFAEAAANELTQNTIDPRAKIPDFKLCAVRIARAEIPADRNASPIPLTDRGAIKDPLSVR
ncbi:MAG: formate dehydrogenase subunit alpha [Chloroflexi bacterium]|nr:formate dehydrogenase subunit alpha [Chloroflexota bacterium]